MQKACLRVALFSVLAVSAAARADTFEYILNADYSYFEGADFDYISSSLLTTPTYVNGNCSGSFQETCLGFDLDPTTGIYEIDFTPNNGVAAVSDTLGQPVLTPGTYTNVNDGIHTTLVISDIPAAVTPEPESLVLVVTGVLGLAGLARRRYLRA